MLEWFYTIMFSIELAFNIIGRGVVVIMILEKERSGSALHRMSVVKVVQVEQTADMWNPAANFFWRFVTDAWNYLVRLYISSGMQ